MSPESHEFVCLLTFGSSTRQESSVVAELLSVNSCCVSVQCGIHTCTVDTDTGNGTHDRHVAAQCLFTNRQLVHVDTIYL